MDTLWESYRSLFLKENRFVFSREELFGERTASFVILFDNIVVASVSLRLERDKPQPVAYIE